MTAKKILQAVGRSQPAVDVQPPPIIAQRSPTTADTDYAKGQTWLDESASPVTLYDHLGGGTWQANQLTLNTDGTFAAASNTTASSSLAIKTYVDGVAVAGAPISDVSTNGIGQIATDAEAVAGQANNPGVTAYFVTPSNLTPVFASPPAIGGTTPAGGAFSTLSASGAFSLSGDQVQVSEGGTGATTAGAARTALGVAIGTDVQAYDAGLADIAGLAVTDGNIIVGDGANWVAESGATARTSLGLAIGTDVQAWNQALEDISGLAVTNGNIIVGDGINWVAESGATARTSLGLAIGTDVQAYDAGLTDIAALAVTDGNIIVGDGANWVAESGATARTSLGLAIGTDVQAYNAGLTDIAGLAVTDGNIIVGDGANWVAESGATARTSLGLDSMATQAASAVAITGGTITGITSYVETASVTIATGDVLTLATTPVELVAAPGAGKYIEFLGAQFILDYNSVPYTEAGDNLGIKYTDASGVQVSSTVECTGFIDQSADTITNAVPAQDAIVAASAASNAALVLDNLGSNFGAGNSPLIVKVSYRIVTTGL